MEQDGIVRAELNLRTVEETMAASIQNEVRDGKDQFPANPRDNCLFLLQAPANPSSRSTFKFLLPRRGTQHETQHRPDSELIKKAFPYSVLDSKH